MNVACLLLPNFKINSELKRHPYLSNRQVLISGFVENKEVIVEYTNNINGVSNGSLLRDVLMKLKNPLIIEEDNQYYSYIFDNLLSGLFKVFDRIEPAKYKCMYIDISDLYIPSYGRNIEIAEEILNIIPECFNSQIGFSTGKYSSYIAALLSSPGKLNALEFNKTNIEKIPAHLLPVTDELKKRMYFLGLTSFGKIASLNKKDLLFQFGKEGGFIWDFVNGKDGSEIKPLKLKDKFITSDDVLITRERHRQHLQQCLDHLNNFNQKKEIEDFDKAAEDLRLATRHLGMIVGKVDVEEILGSIFNDFCIGK